MVLYTNLPGAPVANGRSSDEAIAKKALEIAATAHPIWVDIAKLIPKGEFFRYVSQHGDDHAGSLFLTRPVSYQFALSPLFKSLVTSIAFARFILHDELVPQFTVATLMGRTYHCWSFDDNHADIPVTGEDVGELQLSSDDYLQGVIGMVNELVSFNLANSPSTYTQLTHTTRSPAFRSTLSPPRTLLCPEG